MKSRRQDTRTSERRQAVGYCRVSTEGQADEGISLDMQEVKIREWASLHTYEVLGVQVDAHSRILPVPTNGWFT